MKLRMPLLLFLFANSLAAGAQTLVSSTSQDAAPSPPSLKPINLAIQNGILTVDGFTARMAVRQDIHNAGYLILFVPGTGTVVISLSPIPGSTPVPHGFHGSELSFSAGGRDFALHNETPMPDTDVWIRLDPATADWVGQPFLGSGDAATVSKPGPEMARDLQAARAKSPS